MEPQRCEDFVTSLATWDMSLRAIKEQALDRGQDGDEEDPGYSIVNDTAMVDVTGTLMREVPWILQVFGADASSYRRIAEDVTEADADPQVEEILLWVNSPGGLAAGTEQVADTIYGAEKPVTAYIQDIGASAAYYLASQADRVLSHPTAEIGSIGTRQVWIDSSEMYKERGIEVKQVKSGEYKGVGQPGTEITEEQLEPEQEIVGQLTEMFVNAVARGRGMSTDAVWELATGRVWLGEAAMDLGLVDALGKPELTEESTDGIIGAISVSGGARAQEGDEGEWDVIPFSEHEGQPLADKDTEWDGDAEVEAAEPDELRDMCTVQRGDGEDKEDYKLPHCRQSDKALVWNGVKAAMGAVLGARGGVDIPEDVNRDAYDHLSKAYERFDEEPPDYDQSADADDLKWLAWAGRIRLDYLDL